MKVKYNIKAKKLWSQFHRDAVRAAVEYALDAYDLRGYGKLTVKLNYIPFEYGSAISFDEDDHMIFISANDDIALVIKTVFHELWHIRQYIYDGLELENNVAQWKGAQFSYDRYTEDFDEYLNYPWEVEARNMEEKMYKIYTKG